MMQKTIFIFIAKISKKRGFGEAKMAPKTDFFELWGSLFDHHFSHHILHQFFHDFLSIFESPNFEKYQFSLGKTMIFTESAFSRWKPNFIEKSPPKPFILGARITRKLQQINKKSIPKNNDFLKVFFLDFGKVLGSPDLGVGPVFASKNQLKKHSKKQ